MRWMDVPPVKVFSFLTTLGIGNTLTVVGATSDLGEWGIIWWDGTVEFQLDSVSQSRVVDVGGSKLIRVFSKNENLIRVDAVNMSVTSVNFSGLMTMEQVNFNFNGLTTIDFLQNFGMGIIDLKSNGLTTIDFTPYSSVTSIDISQNSFTTFSVTMLVLLETLIYNSNSLTAPPDISQNVNLKSYRGSANAIGTVSFSTNPLLEDIEIVNCGFSAPVDISNLVNLLRYTVSQNAIGTISVLNNILLMKLRCTSCGLHALSIATNPLIVDLDVSINALTQAVVNAILVQLDTNGLHNGLLHLEGGTNGAPSGAGATAKTALIGKGWTVFTN